MLKFGKQNDLASSNISFSQCYYYQSMQISGLYLNLVFRKFSKNITRYGVNVCAPLLLGCQTVLYNASTFQMIAQYHSFPFKNKWVVPHILCARKRRFRSPMQQKHNLPAIRNTSGLDKYYTIPNSCRAGNTAKIKIITLGREGPVRYSKYCSLICDVWMQYRNYYVNSYLHSPRSGMAVKRLTLSTSKSGNPLKTSKQKINPRIHIKQSEFIKGKDYVILWLMDSTHLFSIFHILIKICCI